MLRKLEKYEIDEEIGHGGMATVYRARDTRLDREVAVKVMHPHLRGAVEARQRFTREAKTVAKLKHGNILEIYDYSGEDSPESYIATELLTGPTLKAFAEAHTDLPPEIAACFAIEIARALSVAHDAGIIHRDVKPENVLLHENKGVKLTDFGIAQMVDAQSMTATGQVLGSPGHMAPEQVEGKDCDARSDLFSLGTVLYFLATGRLPFPGKNPHQILKKIVEGEFADPIRVRPTIGGRMRGVILKLLAREPERRYQSARELERDLAALLAEMGIDDASAQLVSFLRDPEVVAKALRTTAIEKCTALGEKALAAGDLPTAQDHFNRVLALDEGNAAVLAMVARMGRRARRRTVYIVACGVAAVLGLGLGVTALAWPSGPGGGDHTIVPERDAGRAEHDAGSVFAARDAATSHVAAGDASADAEQHAITVVTNHPRQDSTREVLFVVQPQSVRISLDGSPPRGFVDYHGDTLVVGSRHRIAITPDSADSPYDSDTAAFVVPAGEGPYRYEHDLPFKDALVIVAANVDGADVSLDGAHWPSRTGHRVHMTAERRTVTFTVTAPGCRAYTTPETMLVAGGAMTEIPATLVCEGAGGSP